MTSFAVMGHPDREREATALAWMLGGQLVLDEAGGGENATGDRAWSLHESRNDGWHVVVQDDALPVADIHTQAPAALAAAPGPVVSFYLGTSYPAYTIAPCQDAIGRADASNSSWITAPRLFWGVAVAIRADLVPDMLATVRKIKRPYDERISRWAEQSGHTVAYTWPSLIDHADGPSLVGHLMPRMLPRRAYRIGRPDTWTTDPIKL